MCMENCEIIPGSKEEWTVMVTAAICRDLKKDLWDNFHATYNYTEDAVIGEAVGDVMGQLKAHGYSVEWTYGVTIRKVS